MVFTTAQKVTKQLGYFCNNFFCQEIPKIAQSGHTGRDPQQKCTFNPQATLSLTYLRQCQILHLVHHLSVSLLFYVVVFFLLSQSGSSFSLSLSLPSNQFQLKSFFLPPIYHVDISFQSFNFYYYLFYQLSNSCFILFLPSTQASESQFSVQLLYHLFRILSNVSFSSVFLWLILSVLSYLSVSYMLPWSQFPFSLSLGFFLSHSSLATFLSFSFTLYTYLVYIPLSICLSFVFTLSLFSLFLSLVNLLFFLFVSIFLLRLPFPMFFRLLFFLSGILQRNECCAKGNGADFINGQLTFQSQSRRD